MKILASLKSWLFHAVMLGVAVVARLGRAVRQKLKLMFFYQRIKVIEQFNESPQASVYRARVLVMIPHVVAPEEASDPQKGAAKIERLGKTLDGLFASFSHCDLEIWIQTLPDRNIIRFLPQYQQQRLHVEDQQTCEPLYIPYSIQDKLMERQADSFDWFLCIEDDIVIHDSSFLDKLALFNRYCPDSNGILYPNRYEMFEGTKRYIDLTISESVAWDRLSVFEIDGVKYAECENPHSGLYCLTAQQLRRWSRSRRDWRNQNFMVGPQECAVTFSLLECFIIYKPHPQNIYSLEVEHYDTKYSRLYPALNSPYTVSAVSGSSMTPAAKGFAAQ